MEFGGTMASCIPFSALSRMLHSIVCFAMMTHHERHFFARSRCLGFHFKCSVPVLSAGLCILDSSPPASKRTR